MCVCVFVCVLNLGSLGCVRERFLYVLFIDTHSTRVSSAGNIWHKMCFKCKECNTSLSLGSEATNEGNRSSWGNCFSNCTEGEIYCKRCHGAKFGPRGYGYGGAGGTLDSHSYSKGIVTTESFCFFWGEGYLLSFIRL